MEKQTISKLWIVPLILSFILIINLINQSNAKPNLDAQVICDAYIKASESHYESFSECSKELAHWRNTGIKEEDLADESSHWCYLIVTDGEKPIFEDRVIRDIRTLNLSNQQVEGYAYDKWSYWLACDTKYRS